jgi:hypothetical protein
MMRDDFSPLTSSKHWLGWLGDDPARAIRTEIEDVLRQQVATAKVEWVRLLEPPYYLTGGRKAPDDPQKMIVTRAGLAAPFELDVRSASGVDRLRGVFSWVATGLDGARQDRVFLDLDTEFQVARDELQVRLYGLDLPPDADGGTAAE